MPTRVHSATARRNIYSKGITVPAPGTRKGWKRDRSQPHSDGDVLLVPKGQSYFYWTPYRSTKRISLTYPKRQQLTSSAYLITVYDIQDAFQEMDLFLQSAEDILSDLESLLEETQDSLDNMPESLQESSDSGILLTERIEALEEARQCCEELVELQLEREAIMDSQPEEGTEEHDEWSEQEEDSSNEIEEKENELIDLLSNLEI